MTPVPISPAEIAEARARVPRAFARPLPERLQAAGLWAAFLLATLYCAAKFDVTPWRLWAGADGLFTILALMVPPTPGEFLDDLLYGLLQTLAMAFVGTTLATVIAVPLGLLGARNILRVRPLHFGMRRLFDGLRGIDQLIWALVFVRAVGLGPLAGILAIVVSDTGTLAKLFAEAVETADRRQVDGVRATGGNPLQVIRFGVLPQIVPVIVSQALYFFESNTRSATILGIVGAGGIGLQLAERIKANQWSQVGFLIVLILATVAIIDLASRAVRRALIGGRGP